MEVKRKELVSILEKAGVEVPVKISSARASKKIEGFTELPEGLTDREIEILKAINPSFAAVESTPVKKASQKKAQKKAPVKKASKKKAQKKAPVKETEKESKEEKPKEEKPKERGKVMALMARKIKDSGRIVRETLVKEVVSELQVTPWTVANYIALAKKNEEVLGFILDETRGDNGEKFLHPLEG